MSRCGAFALLLSFATLAAGQEARQVPAPAADEVIVFEGHNYDGASFTLKVGDEVKNLAKSPAGNWDLRISSLEVGDDAVVVLYSSVDFKRWCLGLPGRSFHGAGRYPNLSLVKNPSLPTHLDNKVRSLKVLGKDTDLKKVCGR